MLIFAHRDTSGVEIIPTLDEVLELIAGKCTINIELKAMMLLDIWTV